MTDSLHWLTRPAAVPDADWAARATARQTQLTKPPGSLGALETLAIRLAALQARERPQIDTVQITLFAADHGIADEGVSAFPQAVTAQMIDNFAAGGAAISVLARTLGAHLEVVDLGTVAASAAAGNVRRERIAASTANFAQAEAMTALQLEQALNAGRAAAARARAEGADLFIGGEMGIANTTSATALACLLLGQSARQLTGRGTGISDTQWQHKVGVIDRALRLHRAAVAPLDALRCVGGFEIAALVGACIHAAQQSVPVLVDGFIVSVAALLATRQNQSIAPWLIFAHQSAEAGHRQVLDALDAQPLLALGLRLGEASGAALAVPLLRAACAVHAQMATFAEAGVAAKNPR